MRENRLQLLKDYLASGTIYKGLLRFREYNGYDYDSWTHSMSDTELFQIVAERWPEATIEPPYIYICDMRYRYDKGKLIQKVTYIDVYDPITMRRVETIKEVN